MDESRQSPRVTWAFVASLVRLALAGIRAQRLRAVLSALGITVGIAAVIAILAIGEGARDEALRQVQNLGTNTVSVRRIAAATAQQKGTATNATRGLTIGDMVRLIRIVPGIASASPTIDLWSKISAGDREVQAHQVGTTPEAAEVGRLSVRAGRFLTSEDSHTRRRVCVLGAQLSRDLFRLASAVGRRVHVGRDWFTVVGVLESRATADAEKTIVRTRDINRDVYVPIETVAPVGDARDDWSINDLTLSISPDANMSDAARLIRAVLQRTHRGVADYEVVVPLELLEQRRQTQRIFNGVLAGVACLSLLVGGIGIMNIMLATVTERTPEVGLRRAVGATARDIAVQFLVETACLTFLGGLAGTALGLAASAALYFVGGWPVSVSPTTVAGVLVVSGLFGVVFGLYPALKAAAADPIVALRYE